MTEYHDANKPKAKTQHSEWRRKSNTDDPTGFLWVLHRRMGSYRKKNREIGLRPPDFDAEWLADLYKKQNGKCYYTGVQMTWTTSGSGKGTFSRDTVTVDRKDPDGGYFKENIVLCTHSINWTKSDRTDVSFYEICKQVLEHRGLL